MANKPPAAPVKGNTTSQNKSVVAKSNPKQNIAPSANANVSNKPPAADPTAHGQPHSQMRKRRGGSV